MSEMEYLRKPYIRRLFYSVILLLIISLALIRYLLLPIICGQGCITLQLDFFTFSANVIEDIMVSVLVTVGIASFFFWVNPPVQKAPTMEAIEPRLISYTFEKARQQTDFWFYQGGTGTYLRAVTLPENARYAREQKKKRQITIEIIDPSNRHLCKTYSRYRSATASKSKNQSDPWDENRVLQESYATILLVCVYKKEEPALDITIGLSQKMSTFRYDMATDYLIITNEDPKAPATRVDRGTYYYDVYREELLLSLKQAHKIHLENIDGLHRSQLNVKNVRQLFESIKIWDDTMSEDFINNIIGRIKNPMNPYG